VSSVRTTTNNPPPQGIAWRTDTFDSPYLRVISRHSENLESDQLIVIPTLPNFGDLRDALGWAPSLHHVLKSVRSRDRKVVTTQPPKFNDTFPLRRDATMLEILERGDGQSWEER
jgi:hypothetical protein